ncbi:MAG TPA: Lrp/AsnC family transcriptional regulator [Fimbriimonadaceae bacterium]|nr:Lrp/AsnC family transcriptional regulator [Fimbriimonadaceae bacterium]HRJ33253.1 Lrp/AsnC family transcriptional regulator [Fimbriimonadaceae bacterium]
MPKERLDEIDIHLLKLLQKDGRMSNAELARRVGLSPPSVLQRLRGLADEGVIEGYRVELSQKELGYSLTVFALVSLGMHQDRPIDAFRQAVVSIPEILDCHHVSGEFDFLLRIVVQDMAAYERLIREKLSTIKGIGKIQSCFSMATIKSGGQLPL